MGPKISRSRKLFWTHWHRGSRKCFMPLQFPVHAQQYARPVQGYAAVQPSPYSASQAPVSAAIPASIPVTSSSTAAGQNAGVAHSIPAVGPSPTLVRGPNTPIQSCRVLCRKDQDSFFQSARNLLLFSFPCCIPSTVIREESGSVSASPTTFPKWAGFIGRIRLVPPW